MERLFNLDPQLIHDAVLLALAVFVMFTFLSYLLFNPARDFLKKRQDKIKNDLEAARILSRANAQVELERKAAADDMKKEMIALASLMAEKAVAGAVDAKVQDTMVESTLKEIGEDTWRK